MILASLWTLLVLAAGLQDARGSESPGEVGTVDNGKQDSAMPSQSPAESRPLFLTPLIENCSYEEARQKSIVKLFQGMGVNAHSGYITVNKTINLFFLLVVGPKNDSSEPLLLWTQGGPGLSSLFGLFLQNGPVAISEYGNFSLRTNTLQKNMSVIYLDLPVGAGFSFTEVQTAYPHSLEDVIFSVREFLAQFLQLFDYYKGRDFYLGGESYGARYSVAVADWLLLNPGNVSLNLCGVISGSGFLGPVLDIADSGDFLYQMSMMNSSQRDEFKKQFQAMRYVAANASIALYAVKMLSNTIFTNPVNRTLFQTLTSYNDHASPLFTERPSIMYTCVYVFNTSTFKNQIHVGEIGFQYNNPYLLSSFAPDWLRDINHMVENVLNKSSMLFYIGQIDALFPSVNQQAYLSKLNWAHADQYREATRTRWSKPNKVYGADGFIKIVPHLTEALVLGMSHYGAAEKPDEVYYLVTSFVASSSKANKKERVPGKSEEAGEPEVKK